MRFVGRLVGRAVAVVVEVFSLIIKASSSQPIAPPRELYHPEREEYRP
jgi:hypothetical protein